MAETVKGILGNSMGQDGGIYSGAGTITGKFIAIQIITDATITATGNIDNLTSVALSAGTIINGLFTQIVVASGAIIAYKGV